MLSVLRLCGGGWGFNVSVCLSEVICYFNVIFIGLFRVERVEWMVNDKFDLLSLR